MPVMLGDYLEIKTWVSRYGNTSFDWEAEVYKTCELVDQSGTSSACNIIDPPVLVARFLRGRMPEVYKPRFSGTQGGYPLYPAQRGYVVGEKMRQTTSPGGVL